MQYNTRKHEKYFSSDTAQTLYWGAGRVMFVYSDICVPTSSYSGLHLEKFRFSVPV